MPGGSSGGPTFPPGVTLPVLPQASQPVSGLESGMQGAARVADTVAGAVQVATQLSEQGSSGADLGQILPGAVGALGGALGGASSIASGIDPGVSQALGVLSAGSSLVGAGGNLVRSALALVEGAVSEANRHRVTFEFESASTPATPWRVASFTLDERIGRPYVATLVLVNEDLDVDARAMLGERATLTLRRGEDHERVIGGIVRRVELGRTTDRARMVTIELVPAMALLALRKDSRIFQDLDATEVLDAVVGGSLEAYDREIELRTRRSYLRREYCVQYGETDLDFATRLMEEEGITYFFEHDSDGVEKVVLVDDRHAMPALLRDDATVPFVQQREETSDTEHVHELTQASQLRTTSFALADLDWTGAGTAAVIDAHVHGEDAQGRSRESYEHDRAVTLGTYRGSAYGRSDAEQRLGTRRTAHAADARVLQGRGNVIRFEPGRTLTIEDHPVAELDGELLLLSVSHRGHAPELRDLLGNERYAADDVSYECSFTAIPADVPYRMPIVTPKPRVHGMASAIVVGASGQEIHADQHRRVRIQMRWDREGTLDEKSSCFVRVMQGWAGAGFGMLFVPRVGMEVAVCFLDGDPDRPVIAGCLYNGDNPAPYTSEADWTKSTIRTKSSPASGDGEDRFNELRFEDAAGHEQIYVHAERDLDEDVKHDHTTHVRRNQTNTVDADQTERIGGYQRVQVHKSRNVEITETDNLKVYKARMVEVDGDQRRIICGTLHETMNGSTRLEYCEARELHVAGTERQSYGAGRRVAVTGDDESSATMSKDIYGGGRVRIAAQNAHELRLCEGALLESAAMVQLRVGENNVNIRNGGEVSITATTELRLVCGQASITLSADGTIDISGPGGINLACGSSTVSLSSSGVTTSGTQISSTAIADHTIVGAIVRIN